MARLPVRSFHALWPDFPEQFQFTTNRISWSYNPTIAVTTVVWATPPSLAATKGIDVSFFSSSY